MSSDPDELMRQKKAALRAKQTASSSEDTNYTPPPAFNPEYLENPPQQQDQFTDDDNGAPQGAMKPAAASQIPPTTNNFARNEPDHPASSQLPQTMQLLNDKFPAADIPTANVIPIAAAVVPEDDNGGDGNGGGTDPNNNNNHEEELKRKEKNKRLKLLLIIVIIIAIASIAGAVGAVMSKSSSNNENDGANDSSQSTPLISDIAEPMKCSFSSVSGITSVEPFFQEPSCGDVVSTAENQGKWYSLVGDGSCVTLSTCDPATEFDTRIRVFTEDSSGDRVCFAGNDDAFDNISTCPLQSMVSFPTDVGVLYYIFLDGFAKADNGNFVMTIGCASSCPQPAPSPTSKPGNLKNKKPTIPTPTFVKPATPGNPNEPINQPTMVISETPEYSFSDMPSSSATEKDLFTSGSWRQIERINEQADCCTGKTLALSSNKRFFAVSSPFSDWGFLEGAGRINIYRDNLLPTGARSKVGGTIHGQNYNEGLGSNIALSGDGSILVATNDTHVLTYRVFLSFWSKLNDESVTTTSSGKIALSSDGTVLAVSGYSFTIGSVKTFRLINSRWVQFGGTITANTLFSKVESIALSGDGTVLAFGGSNFGAVVYYLKNNGAREEWNRFASLSSSGNNFGNSLALSDDGKVLVVGEEGNIKTFHLNGPAGSWESRDRDIPYFNFGLQALPLSLSSNGTVLILGNYDQDYDFESDGQMDPGRALAYHYDGDNLRWRQFGDLNETRIAAQFGHGVAVSGDGTYLAVAALCYDGCTFIYQLE